MAKGGVSKEALHFSDALEAFGGPNANGEDGTNQAHVGVISGIGSQSNGGWQTAP